MAKVWVGVPEGPPLAKARPTIPSWEPLRRAPRLPGWPSSHLVSIHLGAAAAGAAAAGAAASGANALHVAVGGGRRRWPSATTPPGGADDASTAPDHDLPTMRVCTSFRTQSHSAKVFFFTQRYLNQMPLTSWSGIRPATIVLSLLEYKNLSFFWWMTIRIIHTKHWVTGSSCEDTQKGLNY